MNDHPVGHGADPAAVLTAMQHGSDKRLTRKGMIWGAGQLAANAVAHLVADVRTLSLPVRSKLGGQNARRSQAKVGY
jgi:hypothetical protein